MRETKRGAASASAPFFLPRPYGGWTLIELVIVLVVLSIITYFVVRSFQPKEGLALQQAERLRNDLRHIQMLAITWNEALRVTTTAATPGPCSPATQARYEVSCVTGSATPPCNVNPVIDPATGDPYVVRLECGLDVVGPGFTLDLDTLGRPKNGAALTIANANFQITGASVARIVAVAPLTGFATVQ
jgi:prepilin-type N-terminal cleavage/methylation domain-containing protein